MSLRSLTLATAVVALTAGSATAAPEVTPPEDFGDASAVRASLKEMYGYVRDQEQETGDWRARRAEGICEDALRRLDSRQTSNAYEAKAGESMWRGCHDAYDDLE